MRTQKNIIRQNPGMMAEIENVVRQKALSGEVALPLDMGVDGGEEPAAAAEE